MKIAIIGIGKMGSWFANEFYKQHEVAIYDIDENKTKPYKNLTILKKIDDLKDFSPKLLINAVSIRKTQEVYEEITKFINKNCVICDVASVKGSLQDYYNTCGFEFGSVHPMFGPTFANIDDIKEENAIIVNESSPFIIQFFKEFFKKKQLNIFEFSFKEHDQMIAYSLTLPFASSLVFASCMQNTTVPGTTFKKHKTIVQGLLSEDDNLLADILFNQYSIKQLENVTSRLEFLKHVIRGKDYDEAAKFFEKLRNNII